MKTDIKLPPLPKPERGSVFVRGYTLDDEKLLAWGRAAVEADRQGRVPSDDDVATACKSLGWDLDAQEEADMILLVRTVLSRYSSSQPTVCQECSGDGAGGLHEDDCSQNSSGQPAASAEPLKKSEFRKAVEAMRGKPVAPVAQEPVAWVSKTIAYSKYISDARYRKLRPAAQRWYEPYKCASCAATAQAQPTGYEEAGSFIWDGDEWRMAAAKYGEDPDVVTLYKRVNAQDEPQQSGISGELPSAQDREDAHDIEAAAKTLAECMDYPWEPMPEKGREAMRNHAKRVIDAARAAKERT